MEGRFQAVYLMTSSKKAISAHQLRRILVAAFESLNRRLKEDRARGELRTTSPGPVILLFPGVEAVEPQVIGPIEQITVIEGVVISLGGRDQTVPVRVQNQEKIYVCNTTRGIAKQLGSYLFGSELRFVGTGRWFRREGIGWRMESFRIESFEPFSDRSFDADLAGIRSVELGWEAGADILGEISSDRGEEGSEW